jgi:hypothetical protein
MQQSRQFKIYTILNLIFYAAQMLTILLLTSVIGENNSIITGGSAVQQSPLFVSPLFWTIGWWACIGLQGLFVIRGMFCAEGSVHYQNCVLLKIKFNFMVLCSLLSLSFVMLSILARHQKRPTL